MKGSWQRWMAAGLLAGGLLMAGGCITRDDSEDTGAFRTPVQDKYQSPASGAADNTGTGGAGHPSPQPDEQATRSQVGGGTAAPNDAKLLDEARGGSGRDPTSLGVGTGLGTGLAESYDAAPPPQGDAAMGGAGRGQLGSGEPEGIGGNQEAGGLSGGGQQQERTTGGE